MRLLGVVMLWLACTAEPGRNASELATPIAENSVGDLAMPADGARSVAAGSGGSDATPAAQDAGSGSAGVAVTALPVPRRPASSDGVTIAAHDAEISVLAATEDGAVVSADRRGAVRLWPSIDGKREPVVVDVEVAAERLAIARDGEEIVIAAAGAVGELVVVRVGARGEAVSRVRIDAERRVVALHPVAGGFVGLRDDQALVGIDLRGERRGELRAAPGERIVEMASRRGRLLAFVVAEGSVRGRWIQMRAELAWGSESAALPIDPVHAVLAPDHAHVAAMGRRRKSLVIVGLADGGEREASLNDNVVRFPIRPIGFVDDRTVAVKDDSGDVGWWQRGEWKSGGMGTGIERPGAVTDRRLITADAGAGANLVIDTAEDRRYLGFRLLDVRSIARHGRGWLLSDRRTVLGIDEGLVTRKRYQVAGAEEVRADDVVLLDDRHWIALVKGDAWLLDVAHPERRVKLVTGFGRVQYERTTQLVAIATQTGQWLGRYDPKTGTIRETLELKNPAWIELLDPSMNRGNVARKVVADVPERTRLRKLATTVTITEIAAIDFAATTPLREGAVYQDALPEDLARRFAGMALLAEPWPAEVGERVTQLLPATRGRASPDGAMIATVARGRVALRDRKGGMRWEVALPGAEQVAWTSAGELIAFGGGAARIDLESGAALERRCGWEFGLWDDNNALSEMGAKLCEAP